MSLPLPSPSLKKSIALGRNEVTPQDCRWLRLQLQVAPAVDSRDANQRDSEIEARFTPNAEILRAHVFDAARDSARSIECKLNIFKVIHEELKRCEVLSGRRAFSSCWRHMILAAFVRCREESVFPFLFRSLSLSPSFSSRFSVAGISEIPYLISTSFLPAC